MRAPRRLIRCNWPISASNGWLIHCDAGSAAVYSFGGCDTECVAGTAPSWMPCGDAEIALDSMRERYGAANIVVVGHSMGGRVAAHLSASGDVGAVVALAPRHG
jgi:pimeloyl-ACP methyl ester carboxylesterase